MNFFAWLCLIRSKSKESQCCVAPLFSAVEAFGQKDAAPRPGRDFVFEDGERSNRTFFHRHLFVYLIIFLLPPLLFRMIMCASAASPMASRTTPSGCVWQRVVSETACASSRTSPVPISRPTSLCAFSSLSKPCQSAPFKRWSRRVKLKGWVTD